jgi:hypothetical protein
VGLLSEDDNRALLLLEERSGCKNSGTGGVVLLLHVSDGGDHGVKFLPELSGLSSLAGVISGVTMHKEAVRSPEMQWKGRGW